MTSHIRLNNHTPQHQNAHCKACGKKLESGDLVQRVKGGFMGTGYFCDQCANKKVLVWQPKRRKI